MVNAKDRLIILFLLALGLPAFFAGCADLGSEGMPPNMPIAGHKFAAIRSGMTYAEFEKAFGDGWVSPSSGTEAKYWFFDDGRTLVVPVEVWKVPQQKLSFRIIGIAPLAPKVEIPILQTKDSTTVTTRGTQ